MQSDPSAARTAMRMLAIFSLSGLLISRVALILHEFVGHGALALAFGGEITDYHLFLFGGGWIDFRNPGFALWQRLSIALGGIALQLLLAGLTLLIARRRAEGSLSRFFWLGCTAALAVQALSYLADGTNYGYGDGRLLFRLLGRDRVWVVAPSSLLLVGLLLPLARAISRTAAGW
ncbi:MAG: hypothetical protein KC609_17075, partial [Myxococcales bacterium]|nr:hypothetical protein [Myxococcales bacterium]